MTARDTGPLARLASPRRARLTAGAAVVLVVAALAVAVLMSAMTAASSAPTPVPSATADDAAAVTVEAGSAEGAAPLVHVLGAVRAPGLYELGNDARVVDAIGAAGGLADAADPAGVNLARRIVDGEQITVPIQGSAPIPSAGGGAGSGTGAGGTISLSSATAEQLDDLPRIGPTIAQRIVEWREAGGRFTAVDDLLEIEGVGAKTVDALRDLVAP